MFQSWTVDVQEQNNPHTAGLRSDMALVSWMEPQLRIPWVLEMKAVSAEEPSRLVASLAGDIAECGGWVLNGGADDRGKINFLFEFERHSCLDIYCILVAAGVELTRSGHLRFTELYQCTRSQQRSCGAEIASVDLEIQPFPADNRQGSIHGPLG